MKNKIRTFIAIAIYLVSFISLILFFVNDFVFYYLIASITGFVLAHIVHPKRVKGATKDSLDVLDITYSLIEVTFEILMLPFRFIAKIVDILN